MKYRPLGNTGLQVSELGLGGLFISSYGAEREEARRTVHRALELGVNYFDTAPSYYDSEVALGCGLAGVTQPHIVSTKLSARWIEGEHQDFDPQDKAALRRSVEQSLSNLGRDSIDILMIHEPDRPGQFDWYSDHERFTGPVCELLAELKDEGIIRFSGLGGTTAHELPRIIATGAYDVVLTAFNYSLLWQEAMIEVLPEARRQRMGIIVGSPLQQGALARRYDEEVEQGARWLSSPRREQYGRLYAPLDEVQMPLAEMALRFVISNPEISCTLTGARSVAELESNVRSVERGPLPGDLLARVNEIAAMVPFRPFEEPFSLPFGGRERRGPGWAR